MNYNRKFRIYLKTENGQIIIEKKPDIISDDYLLFNINGRTWMLDKNIIKTQNYLNGISVPSGII